MWRLCVSSSTFLLQIWTRGRTFQGVLSTHTHTHPHGRKPGGPVLCIHTHTHTNTPKTRTRALLVSSYCPALLDILLYSSILERALFADQSCMLFQYVHHHWCGVRIWSILDLSYTGAMVNPFIYYACARLLYYKIGVSVLFSAGSCPIFALPQTHTHMPTGWRARIVLRSMEGCSLRTLVAAAAATENVLLLMLKFLS